MEKISLVPFGGLANRMRAIAGTIAFCSDHKDIPLTILWFKDWGMGADFRDLFTLSPDLRNVVVREASFSDQILRDRPRKRNLSLPALFLPLFYDGVFTADKYARLAREIGSENALKALLKYRNVYLASCWDMYPSQGIYAALQPNASILTSVNQSVRELGNHSIGIHIRRTDQTQSILKSTDDLFVDKIRSSLEADSSLRFYLATDDQQTKEKMKALFGDCILFNPRPALRDTKAGIIDALIEMLILSRTSQIWGSYCSSFSEVAAAIGGIQNIVVQK